MAEARDHHEYSPSKLNYLKKCPRFKNKPSDGGPASEEGDELHQASENIINLFGDFLNKGDAITLTEVVEAYLKESAFTPEQKESLRMVMRDVEDVFNTNPNWTSIVTEPKLKVLNPDGSTYTSGYADLILFVGETAFIFDYKFGRVPVEPARKNFQGKAYALGVFQEHPEVMGIHVIFLQPRILTTHGSKFCFYVRQDEEHLFSELRSVIEPAKDPKSFPVVNDHCKYCVNAGTCSALYAFSRQVYLKQKNLPDIPDLTQPDKITTPSEMAVALSFVKQMEALIEPVKAAALEMSANGNPILEGEYNGKHIKFERKERLAPRKVGEASAVWNHLKAVMTAERFAVAAKLSIGELEKQYAECRTEQDPNMTKKEALIELNNLLQDNDLISTSDFTVAYLKETKDT